VCIPDIDSVRHSVRRAKAGQLGMTPGMGRDALERPGAPYVIGRSLKWLKVKQRM